MRLDEVVVARSRWQLAVLGMELKLLRLELVLRAYNPNQPRVPAGQPDGGQWASDVASPSSEDGDTAHVCKTSEQNKDQYKVLLEEEEKLGGHTIEMHVGKSDTEMMIAFGKASGELHWPMVGCNATDRSIRERQRMTLSIEL